MAIFQQKPILIEAMQYLGLSAGQIDKAVEFDDWLCRVQPAGKPCKYIGHKLVIPMPDGPVDAHVGDWIVARDGRLLRYSQEDFEDVYEAFEDPDFADLPSDNRTVAEQAVATLKS